MRPHRASWFRLPARLGALAAFLLFESLAAVALRALAGSCCTPALHGHRVSSASPSAAVFVSMMMLLGLVIALATSVLVEASHRLLDRLRSR